MEEIVKFQIASLMKFFPSFLANDHVFILHSIFQIMLPALIFNNIFECATQSAAD